MVSQYERVCHNALGAVCCIIGTKKNLQDSFWKDVKNSGDCKHHLGFCWFTRSDMGQSPRRTIWCFPGLGVDGLGVWTGAFVFKLTSAYNQSRISGKCFSGAHACPTRCCCTVESPQWASFLLAFPSWRSQTWSQHSSSACGSQCWLFVGAQILLSHAHHRVTLDSGRCLNQGVGQGSIRNTQG